MVASLLFFYGLFLILCGIVSFVFIGMKAKTALISGGTSGVLAMTAGHFAYANSSVAAAAGIALSLGLFIVFAWRSTKTLFTIFELLASTQRDELKGKGIAFLIISLMAVVSIFVTFIQLINF
jgi:hypothetical protein